MKQMNKKGTIFEIFVIIIVAFLIAITLPIAKTIYTEVNESVSDQFGDGGTSTALNKAESLFGVLDGLFLFAIIGLGIAGVVMAYHLNFPGFFWIFAVIIAAIGTIVAGIISNAQQEFYSAPQLAEAAAEFSGTNFIMSNLVLFIVGISFMIIVVMFIKFRRAAL